MNQKKYIQLLLLLLLPQRFPTRKQPRKQSFCPYSSYILSHFGRNTNSSISVYLLFDERGRFPATRHVRMTNPSHDSSLNFLRQIRARSTSSPFPLLPPFPIQPSSSSPFYFSTFSTRCPPRGGKRPAPIGMRL